MNNLCEGSMKSFMSLHNKLRDVKQLSPQKYFSVSEFFTLSKLYTLAAEENGGEVVGKEISMKKLIAELNVSPAMVTKTVTALEENGCVSRVSDRSDRRGVNVSITENGYEKWREEYEIFSRTIRSIFTRFGEEKTKQLFALSEELLLLIQEEKTKLRSDDRKG